MLLNSIFFFNKNLKTYRNCVPIVVLIDDEKLRYLPETDNINCYIKEYKTMLTSTFSTVMLSIQAVRKLKVNGTLGERSNISDVSLN